MGALALLTPWLPQDDLLLKNSIEAGASLESLARGAVQFSRRFTMKELQDRWLSLLYDPAISAQASVEMYQAELHAVPSKSKKGDEVKETKLGDIKRKVESVRSCFYSMRKRFCSESLYQGDFSFLMDNTFMNEAGALEIGGEVEEPMASEHGLYEISPRALRGEFSVGQQNPNDHLVEQNIPHEQIPHMMGNCASSTTRYNVIRSINDEANPVCGTDEIMISDNGGNTIFNSPIGDSGTLCGQMGYVSSLPDGARWRTGDGLSQMQMPDDLSVGGENVQTVDPFGIPNDSDPGPGAGTSEHGVIHTQPNMTSKVSFGGFNNPTGFAGGFIENISDALFNLPSEEEADVLDDTLFDGTYLGDLDSLLRNPEDDFDYKMSSFPETEEFAAADCPSSTSSYKKTDGIAIHIGESIVQSSSVNHLNTSDGNSVYGGVCQKDVSKLQTCSASQVCSSAGNFEPQFPEYHNGVICCTLSTEDPEIPCNDDIVFPSKRQTAVHKRTQNKATFSAKDKTGTQAIQKDLNALKMESEYDLHELRDNTYGGEILNGPRDASVGYGGLCQTSVKVKKELPDQLGCSVSEKSGQVAKSNLLPTGAGGIDQEDLDFAQQLAAELDEEHLSSDAEEQFFESDTDIPCFSDVEAMILDMDLGPADQDDFFGEVEKYQHEDAKRAIIRLEQNAHSFMQRDIASHGAFAILYGRHAKHYIKKPEVLLGRGTETVVVDIDLSREGRTNKISRRQAAIKLDKDGSFYLKNMGRCSIYVNRTEILPGQFADLCSNCFIEIRGMPFIFEINQLRVKLHLDKILRNN